MYYVCYQCGRHMGTTEPYEDKTEIYRVCKVCETTAKSYEKEKKEVKRTKVFLMAGGATL